MRPYFGVVVLESLQDLSWVSSLDVIGSRAAGAWTLLLVRVPAEALETHLRLMQSGLRREGWYAHYFRGNDLVVVYPDGVYHADVVPSAWQAILTHGRMLGIPDDQLDYSPRTIAGAAEAFGVDIAALV